MIQGGEDVYGARSLEFIFHKRALYLVVLLQKETCNLRHPTYVRHPVPNILVYSVFVWHF